MEWQYVSSKSNALVVRLAKLKDKKYRKAEGLFRFDGIKLFCEAVKNGAPISYVLVCESASDEIKRIAEESGVNAAFYILSESAFEKLTDELSPEGIITVCSELKNIENGEHTLELMLYTHRYNTFGPLHLVDEKESWHGPDAWRSEGSNWSYEYVLRRVGIMKAPVIE